MRPERKGAGPGESTHEAGKEVTDDARDRSRAEVVRKLRDLRLEVHRHEGAAILDGRMIEYTTDAHLPELVTASAVTILRAFGLPMRYRLEVERRVRLAILWGSL